MKIKQTKASLLGIDWQDLKKPTRCLQRDEYQPKSTMNTIWNTMNWRFVILHPTLVYESIKPKSFSYSNSNLVRGANTINFQEKKTSRLCHNICFSKSFLVELFVGAFLLEESVQQNFSFLPRADDKVFKKWKTEWWHSAHISPRAHETQQKHNQISKQSSSAIRSLDGGMEKRFWFNNKIYCRRKYSRV